MEQRVDKTIVLLWMGDQFLTDRNLTVPQITH